MKMVVEGDPAVHGQLSSSDVDDDATAVYSVNEGFDIPSGFSLNESGAYSFDPSDPAYEYLDLGETLVVGIPVLVTDDNGATDSTVISFKVIGTREIIVTEDDLQSLTGYEGSSGVSSVTSVVAETVAAAAAVAGVLTVMAVGASGQVETITAPSI